MSKEKRLSYYPPTIDPGLDDAMKLGVASVEKAQPRYYCPCCDAPIYSDEDEKAHGNPALHPSIQRG